MERAGRWPLVAVNMSLEPTGQVLDLGRLGCSRRRRCASGTPFSRPFIGVPYTRNLFCSGHTQLRRRPDPDRGGHIAADLGTADTTLFDSRTNTYTRGPDMTVGRWYPTVTQLADGRALVFSGDNIVRTAPGSRTRSKDAAVNSLPEIYNPKTNTWTDLTSATLTSPLYPFMFLLSNGKVFDAGPDTVTRTLDTTTGHVDDRRDEPVRRHERGDVPAGQDHEGRHVGRPRLQRRERSTTPTAAPR